LSSFFRRRLKAAGVGAMALALAASATIALTTTPANADTAPGYVTGAADYGSGPYAQVDVPDGGSLTGLVDGQSIQFDFNSTGAGNTVPRVEMRQCVNGSTIASFTEFRPSTGGFCGASTPAGNTFFLDYPTNAVPSAGVEYTDTNTDNFPAQTHVGYPFLVSTGSATNSQSGGPVLVCDAANSCELWARVQQPQGGSLTETYVHWDVTFAGTPDAPVVTAVTPGSGQLSVAFTAPANTGNAPITDYTVTAHPQGGGADVVAHGSGSPVVVSGLNNFSTYDVTVKATNTASNNTTHFTSGSSNLLTGTPAPAGPTALSVAPINNGGSFSWTAAPVAPDFYEAVYCARVAPATPCTPATAVNAGTGTAFNVTGLTNGTVYDALVRAAYGANRSAPSNTVTFVPGAASNTQTITVRRPQGALVLTQVCGARGAVTTGTAPTFAGGPGGLDPLFSQYPYPVDGNGDAVANYPTDCGINLGNAALVTSGPGAGQYFRKTGNLHQVTVVDTRDTDAGWVLTGTMGNFTSGVNSFSGSHLGWTPIKTSDTPAYDTDLDGILDYDQSVTAGPVVGPSTVNGLGNGETWASAPAAAGLGIARLDADITLNIPVVNNTGTYTGVLTITVV
jgi:hypothetical protein